MDPAGCRFARHSLCEYAALLSPTGIMPLENLLITSHCFSGQRRTTMIGAPSFLMFLIGSCSRGRKEHKKDGVREKRKSKPKQKEGVKRMRMRRRRRRRRRMAGADHKSLSSLKDLGFSQ